MKNFKLFKLLALFIVLITSIPQVKAGYIYLDPSGFTNWYNDECWFSLWNDDAKVRINTRTDLGNGLWRFNVGSYPTGHYYFQRMKKGEAETVYNQVDGNVTTSNNVMKITDWNSGSLQSFAISYYHNTNEIFFDNSVSNFTGNIYFVIGRDYNCTGSSETYSVAYKMSPIVGTKLYHVQTDATWNDANYYAIIASTSATISETNWGSNKLSNKGNNGYTAAYKTVYDIEGGSYLITTSAAGNGKAITISYAGANYYDLTKYNATQAAKKRDSGTTYSAITGSNAWPATLKLSGSYLKNTTDTARSTITSTAANDAESARVYGTIMTGTVTQSITSLSSSYYHEGWGTGSSPTNTSATHEYNITEATTVYAFFSKYYTLTYDKKGTTGTSTLSVTSVANYSGATSSSSKIPTGHQIVLTASPATGYRLVSPQAWFSDASCSSSLSNGTNTTYTITSLNANSGVYAKFELIPYTITYNLNGGENDEDNPSGYNVTSATITLEDPSREGYTFDGWYASSTFSGSKVTSIPSGSTGNKEYWAKWTANTYEVQFNANYPSGYRFSSGSMDNQDFTYDVAQSLTANAFVCEGYNFLGWSASSSATSATYTNSQSVSNLTSTDEATFNLYAVWEDNNTYYFDGGTSGTNTAWATAANWTKGAAPSDMDNHTVIILKPAQVTADATVKVKNVRIANAGSYTPTNGSAITAAGTLTIPSTGALVVKENIKNCNVSSEAESPTTWRTLHILSSSSGTGALVAGSRVEHDTASVSFYTKACQPSVGKYVNQFFGIPFSSSSVNNYYGVYLYKHDAATNAFTPSSSATMTAFTAYLMLRTDLSPATLYMEGELLLPGTSDTYKGKNLSLIGAIGKKVSNMFANSWTAPIDLRAMTSADFDGVEATFYLFNAGKSDDTNAGKAGDGAGQWTVLPVEAIKADWSADSDLDDYPQYVLPSQQAFLVVATTDEEDAAHTLKLDYKKHVYNPAVANGVTIEPTRAPRRDDFVLPEQINLYATGASGNSDRVIIYSREDFSTGFDNGWEGYKINGSDFAPQMYTMSDNGKMAINAIPDVEGSVIGFKPGTEDVQYTFTFKYRGENTWYLNDLKEQTSTLIDELDSYTFTSAEGDMEARFIISRTPIAYMPTGIDNGDGAVEGVSVRKLMIDGKLYIIRNGQMFTAEGQMVK